VTIGAEDSEANSSTGCIETTATGHLATSPKRPVSATKATELAARRRGYGVGCSAADFDNDGDLDLYVLNYGPNVFYRNNGDGTFTDISKTVGLANSDWSLSAPWFDYDNDGDLDVYVANYLEYDGGKFKSFYAAAGYPGPLSYNGQEDVLYRNNGDGTFTDVTDDAGLHQPNGRAMSAAVSDLNNDGLLDIYVTNDGMENYYFKNLGNGKFRNEGLIMGLAFGEGGQGVSSMGPTIGDVDRDGLLDIYIPDMAASISRIARHRRISPLSAGNTPAGAGCSSITTATGTSTSSSPTATHITNTPKKMSSCATTEKATS